MSAPVADNINKNVPPVAPEAAAQGAAAAAQQPRAAEEGGFFSSIAAKISAVFAKIILVINLTASIFTQNNMADVGNIVNNVTQSVRSAVELENVMKGLDSAVSGVATAARKVKEVAINACAVPVNLVRNILPSWIRV